MNTNAQGNFPSTDCTLITRLRSGHETVAMAELEELCAAYQYPYCFTRRRRLAHHDAQDALQDFLAKLLRDESLQSTRQEHGRRRSFLATAISPLMANWHRDHAKERLNVEA